MEYKIYKWRGKGHYLSANIICVASNFQDAKTIILGELKNIGLEHRFTNDNQIKETELRPNTIIYSDNGDY